MILKKLLFLTLCLGLASEGTAQLNKVRWEKRMLRRGQMSPSAFGVTVRTGPTFFWGELKDRNIRSATGIGLTATYFRTSSLSLGVDVHYGTLGGEKKAFFNSGFRTHYYAVEAVQRWDIGAFLSREEDNPYHLHLIAGIGLAFFRANAYDLDTGERIRFSNHPANSARTPLFRRWGPPQGPPGIRQTRERLIPVGMVFDYDLTPCWKAGVDLRWYFARTDKLDATSGYRLLNPEEADSYSDTPNDCFSQLTVSVGYRFLRRRGRK